MVSTKARPDTMPVWALTQAVWNTAKLAFQLPRRLLEQRFSRFKAQQPVPPMPRSLTFRLKALLFMYPLFFLLGREGRFRSNRKAIYTRMLGHLEQNATPIAEPDPLLEIEKKDLRSHLEHFYDHPAPFVVRNYNPDSPAVQNWGLDWFAEHYGDFLCSSSEASDHTPQKLSSLLSKDYYVNFLDRIFRAHPELEDQLEVTEIKHELPDLLGIEHTYNEIFMSGIQGSGSSLHNHSVWNFFLQISGRKKWTLVDPQFSHLTYSLSNTMEFGSQMGMKEDPSIFPLYAFCPKYSVTLNPGDLLFNPPMWWHRIDNLMPQEDPQKGSIGVTLKYYNSAQDSGTTFSDPRFNLFNESLCLWRGLFLFRYARFLSRPRTKYTTEPDADECPVQARVWGHQDGSEESMSRWNQFRFICLNDPEANDY